MSEIAVTRRPHDVKPDDVYGLCTAWCTAHGAGVEAVAHLQAQIVDGDEQIREATVCRACLLDALAALDAEAAT